MRLGWLVLAVALGCGYSVVGSRTLFGAHTIVVMPFTEVEPLGLAPDLAQELSALVASGGAALSLNRATADGVLSGEIRDVVTSIEPGERGIVSYRLRATVEAALVVRGKEMWRTVLPVNENFLPAPSPDPENLSLSEQNSIELSQSATTEAYRREAMVRIAQSAARALHEQLTIAGGI